MTSQMALDLAYQAIMTAAKLSAPVLVTAIVVGVAVNIIQTVTSIKDMSLTFVPKVAAAIVVVGYTLPWMIETVTTFFQTTYSMFNMVSP